MSSQSSRIHSLEHHHTADIVASTALTVLAHSLIAGAYSVTCASMTAAYTTMPTTPIHHFGHMRIHDSGIHRNADNTDTSCAPSAPAILSATATPTALDDIPQPLDFSCPHCARKFNSRIGLVGHLRIHRTEACEPGPGAPTYI
ncbi:unnamed protein product [Schistocephalus solidus]|uniref:C2H2-type domain-containing protein n=1 Tax=Schistocephalus solidus TaxID=70667 RepID=A0A183SZH7_SCHSO|nr:unnamed protein product [Schistocephalus solidus]